MLGSQQSGGLSGIVENFTKSGLGDKLTPDGKIPAPEALQQGLGSLLKNLGV